MSAGAPQVEDLKQFAVRLVAIAELLEERSERAVSRVDRGAERLERVAQSIGVDSAHVARGIADGVRDPVLGMLRDTLGDATAHYRSALDAAASAALRATHDWDTHRRALHAEQRRLRWTGWVALLVGSVLAAVGSGLLVRQHMRELAQARFGEDVLAATRAGAITRCGERLCVRVGEARARGVRRGDYVPVDR